MATASRNEGASSLSKHIFSETHSTAHTPLTEQGIKIKESSPFVPLHNSGLMFNLEEDEVLEQDEDLLEDDEKL